MLVLLLLLAGWVLTFFHACHAEVSSPCAVNCSCGWCMHCSWLYHLHYMNHTESQLCTHSYILMRTLTEAAFIHADVCTSVKCRQLALVWLSHTCEQTACLQILQVFLLQRFHLVNQTVWGAIGTGKRYYCTLLVGKLMQ